MAHDPKCWLRDTHSSCQENISRGKSGVNKLIGSAASPDLAHRQHLQGQLANRTAPLSPPQVNMTENINKPANPTGRPRCSFWFLPAFTYLPRVLRVFHNSKCKTDSGRFKPFQLCLSHQVAWLFYLLIILNYNQDPHICCPC